MGDIVGRLSAFHGPPRCPGGVCVVCDATAEIERLRALIGEWCDAADGPHWRNADGAAFFAACARLAAAEDALKKEASDGGGPADGAG